MQFAALMAVMDEMKTSTDANFFIDRDGDVLARFVGGSRDPDKKRRPRGPVTHGVLHRYVIQFPNSNEAQNFHHSIAYVHLLEPARLGQIPTTFDGRTVIVYAYSRYYTKALMQKEAKIYGGKIVGSGRVLR